MDSSSEDKGAAMAIPPLKPGEKFHLFVSYSSMDATWTHGLIGRLEADHAGLRVCLHERDFTPGRNILENMAECIHQSQKVLLVLSQDFVQSRWCLLEADLSLFGYCLERKPVIPVLLRPCQVPLHLSHLTYLEAVDSRFYSKVAQLLCTPSHCMGQPALVEGGDLQHPERPRPLEGGVAGPRAGGLQADLPPGPRGRGPVPGGPVAVLQCLRVLPGAGTLPPLRGHHGRSGPPGARPVFLPVRLCAAGESCFPGACRRACSGLGTDPTSGRVSLGQPPP
ncbi:toll-like receptor 4 isoform X2 [Eptesicus fuscus]|uniref:toll-like receptor 4 isoform X2 n=1 Tax=Eptesicus fuscus TaxID=29078 RepID=UPI0024041C46|nr:toll-like receptor 4 isoform X2 [Eptesicus fuscus]